MKLDPTVLRTMNAQDFRVMEAVEKGMKDHEIVPEALISAHAQLRHGGAHKIISSLLRDKLLSHERKQSSGGYDGYRLTNAGYDILALHNLKARGFIAAMGQRIGTGKESDIYLAVNKHGEQIVLKFHRLGRTSFRNVKKKRDYFGKAAQQAHSWLFLSKLSALKEFAFMKALHKVNYPTPTPVAHNRHIVVMELVRGIPLYQLFPKQVSVHQAEDIYEQAVGLAKRLAQHGLIHCDLNEFNLMVDLSGIQALATTKDDPYVRHSGQSVVSGVAHSAAGMTVGTLSKPAWEQSLEEHDQIQEALPEPAARLPNGEPKPIVTLIDFPQMISTKHPNAQELYERDMACLRRFFQLKLLCQIPDSAGAGTSWEEVMAKQIQQQQEAAEDDAKLDAALKASGFNDQLTTGLELYYFDSGADKEHATGIDTVPEEEESNEDEDSEYAESSIDDEEEDIGDSSQQIVVDSSNLDQIDHDNDHNHSNPQSHHVKSNAGNDTDDVRSVATNLSRITTASASVRMVDGVPVVTVDREKLIQQAKDKVRRQMDEQKRKSKKQGAFRSRNNNKNYVKGKRVLKEAF